jgi:hypothetical protein
MHYIKNTDKREVREFVTQKNAVQRKTKTERLKEVLYLEKREQ